MRQVVPHRNLRRSRGEASGCDGLRFYLFLQVNGTCQKVEDSWRKRGVREVRRPKASDQADRSNGSGKNIFVVSEQPRFKKGHHC